MSKKIIIMLLVLSTAANNLQCISSQNDDDASYDYDSLSNEEIFNTTRGFQERIIVKLRQREQEANQKYLEERRKNKKEIVIWSTITFALGLFVGNSIRSK